MSDSSLKLKRVESPDRKVLFYFDEVIIQLPYRFTEIALFIHWITGYQLSAIGKMHENSLGKG